MIDSRFVIKKEVLAIGFLLFFFLVFRPVSLWMAVKGDDGFDLLATILFLAIGLLGAVAYSLITKKLPGTVYLLFLGSILMVVLWNYFFNARLDEYDVDFFNYYYAIILHVVYFGWGVLYGFMVWRFKYGTQKVNVFLFLALSFFYIYLMRDGGFSQSIVDYSFSASYHFIGLSYSVLVMYVLFSGMSWGVVKFLGVALSFFVLYLIGNKGAMASLAFSVFLCGMPRLLIIAALLFISLIYFVLPEFLYSFTGLETIRGRAFFDVAGYEDILMNGGVFAGQVIKFGEFGTYMHNIFSYVRQFGFWVGALAFFILFDLVRKSKSKEDRFLIVFFVSQVLFFRTFANALILFPVGYIYAAQYKDGISSSERKGLL